MTPSPGRPRATGIDDTVLAATMQLLRQHGYAGLRINDIADVSKVAKTTIYRRWPTLAHLVVAAMEQSLGRRSPLPTGDLFADLDHLVDVSLGAFVGSGTTLMTVALDIHRQEDPDLRARYRRKIIDPFRDHAVAIVTAGVEKGTLAPGSTPEALVDAMIGGLIYRAAILAEPVSPDQSKDFLRAVLLSHLAPQENVTPASKPLA